MQMGRPGPRALGDNMGLCMGKHVINRLGGDQAWSNTETEHNVIGLAYRIPSHYIVWFYRFHIQDICIMKWSSVRSCRIGPGTCYSVSTARWQILNLDYCWSDFHQNVASSMLPSFVEWKKGFCKNRFVFRKSSFWKSVVSVLVSRLTFAITTKLEHTILSNCHHTVLKI